MLTEDIVQSKSIHISISHYYEMLYIYSWINFLFTKMKQVSSQLILLIPIPHIKETCGGQTLLYFNI